MNVSRAAVTAVVAAILSAGSAAQAAGLLSTVLSRRRPVRRRQKPVPSRSSERRQPNRTAPWSRARTPTLRDRA
jgi:hypothetical protein